MTIHSRRKVADVRRRLEVLDPRMAVEHKRIHDMATEIMSLWELKRV
jgi:hypothetical protein